MKGVVKFTTYLGGDVITSIIISQVQSYLLFFCLNLRKDELK